MEEKKQDEEKVTPTSERITLAISETSEDFLTGSFFGYRQAVQDILIIAGLALVAALIVDLIFNPE